VVATGIAAPNMTSIALAGTGGALAGASIAHELRRKKDEEREESIRVAHTFSALYDSNAGLISPQQLSLLSATDLTRIETFVDKLAQEQRGQKIETPEGTIYNFPHPRSVLDRLTENANAWVRDTTEALRQQNATLQQQLNIINAAAAVKGLQSEMAPTEQPDDPWTKML
jgi:hypothetical protein